MQPERIGDILLGVMRDIAERMIRYSEQHRRRVLSAVADYHKHRHKTKSGGSLHRAGRRSSIVAERDAKVF